jgi:hypothetical protein
MLLIGLTAIGCILWWWLVGWVFRAVAFTIRGATHRDVDDHPEIAKLVGQGYERIGSLSGWLKMLR